MKDNSKTPDLFYATGKRKTAIAKVWLAPNGEGRFLINRRPFENYFGHHIWQKSSATRPLVVAKLDKADVKAHIVGGGLTGQAQALSHGLARAIGKMDGKMRKLMRDHGLLTRDARIVERKKPGRPKARKRFQYSKR